MMLSAFFDESGTNPREDEALVVGGFLGSVEEWEKASDAWDDCLEQHPRIAYFKHQEAQALDGEFREFSRKSADDKIEALARVIASFDLMGFCSTVSYSWFEYRDASVAKKQMGMRPYDWGFVSVVNCVLWHLHESGVEDKVDFIFDNRGELSACIPIFYELKNDSTLIQWQRAGGCVPGDDKQLVALQMADLLSWEFSHTIKTEEASEPFAIISRRHAIRHCAAKIHPVVPEMFFLQGIMNEIRSESYVILNRCYKDNDRSPEIWDQITAGAIKREALEALFKQMAIRHGMPEIARQFEENQRALREQLRARKQKNEDTSEQP
jgi:hypothetical protein